MALKNKDGSVYKLRSPNPILVSQDKWDGYKKYNFTHNKFIDGIFTKSISRPEVQKLEDKPQEIIEPEEQKHETKPKDSNKIDFKCLIAKNIQTQDDVYGDVYNKIEYQKGIIFEGYILDIEDLSMQILSPIKIEKNSIITYDRRWWRVENNIEHNENFIIGLTISDYCPNF